jgi:hypothetical protein
VSLPGDGSDLSDSYEPYPTKSDTRVTQKASNPAN